MGDNETCKRVQSFLKTKFQVSSVPFPWIEGCVTWFRNIHANTTNIQELFDFVAQQWLLADFQHLKIKSLPPNLKNTSVLKLDENYLLQVTHPVCFSSGASGRNVQLPSPRSATSSTLGCRPTPNTAESARDPRAIPK